MKKRTRFSKARYIFLGVTFCIRIGEAVLFIPRKISLLLAYLFEFLRRYRSFLYTALRSLFIILCVATLAYSAFKAVSFFQEIPAPRSLAQFPQARSVDIFDRNGILLARPIQASSGLIQFSDLSEEEKKMANQNIPIRKALPLLASYVLWERADKSDGARLLAMGIKLRFYFSDQKLREAYLNILFLDGNLQGVDTAAHAYFNKSADALTPKEFLTLLKLPAFSHPIFPSSYPGVAGYARASLALDLVLDDLKQYAPLIEKGEGLKIYATIDAKLQNDYQASLLEKSIACQDYSCSDTVVAADVERKEVLAFASLEKNVSKYAVRQFCEEREFASIIKIADSYDRILFENTKLVNSYQVSEFIFHNGKLSKGEEV